MSDKLYQRYKRYRDELEKLSSGDYDWESEEMLDFFLQDSWENTESERDLEWVDCNLEMWLELDQRYNLESDDLNTPIFKYITNKK